MERRQKKILEEIEKHKTSNEENLKRNKLELHFLALKVDALKDFKEKNLSVDLKKEPYTLYFDNEESKYKDLKEYKLQILKKEYHHESDVVRIVSNMNYNFKSKLMAIPSKISVQLLNKNNQLEIEDILKKAVINVLEELVDYKYEESEFGEDEDTGETYNKIN